MNKAKLILVAFLAVCSLQVSAADFKASLFGIKSDGHTLNTRSIQKAIDFIAGKGGGTLVFYVGRYQTGSVALKSNVSIRLEEGAILVASNSPYDYKGGALISADTASNIGITGKGVIEGRGAGLIAATESQLAKGYLKSSLEPALIAFTNCSKITVDGITMNESAGNVQVYTGCKDLTINNVTMVSKIAPASVGITLTSCEGATLTKDVFNVSGTPIVVSGGKSIVATSCMDLVKGKSLQLKK